MLCILNITLVSSLPSLKFLRTFLDSLSHRMQLDMLDQEQARESSGAEEDQGARAESKPAKEGDERQKQELSQPPHTTKREKKKFNPKGYPGSRPMHQEVNEQESCCPRPHAENMQVPCDYVKISNTQLRVEVLRTI